MDDSSFVQPLLDRLRDGDPTVQEDARNRLAAHTRERLRKLIQPRLKEFPQVFQIVEASDLLQEAWMRFDAALRKIPAPTLLDYLRLSALHLRWALIDAARVAHDYPGLWASPPDAGTSTDDPAKLALWADFHRAVGASDPEDLQLFDLILYQELTQPEAAALLGKPLKTLKTHWQHARLRLMHRIGDNPFLT